MPEHTVSTDAIIRCAGRYSAEAIGLNPLGRDGKIRKGCVVVLAESDGTTTTIQSYGVFGDEGEQPYIDAAKNKIAVLVENPMSLLSRTHRDPDADPPIWSGAIRLDDGRILSISGFPEYLDEASVTATAIELSLVNADQLSYLNNPNGEDLAVAEQLAQISTYALAA